MFSGRFVSILGIAQCLLLGNWIHADEPTMSQDEKVFEKLNQKKWEMVFEDPCTGNWQDKWFLDGERCTVENSEKGMHLTSGPIFNDHACHMVLWTEDLFVGDIKIEYDYTRMDTATQAVNILYIQATGIGEEPYHKDIKQWADLREIPYMSSYFRRMNCLHISYAAFGNHIDPQKPDYVRLRRYPAFPGKDFGTSTYVEPDYHETGLFKPGVSYRITVIKVGHELSMRVENEDVEKTFAWNTSEFPLIEEGRVGLRQMFTRSARYKDFKIYSSR